MNQAEKVKNHTNYLGSMEFPLTEGKTFEEISSEISSKVSEWFIKSSAVLQVNSCAPYTPFKATSFPYPCGIMAVPVTRSRKADLNMWKYFKLDKLKDKWKVISRSKHHPMEIIEVTTYISLENPVAFCISLSTKAVLNYLSQNDGQNYCKPYCKTTFSRSFSKIRRTSKTCVGVFLKIFLKLKGKNKLYLARSFHYLMPQTTVIAMKKGSAKKPVNSKKEMPMPRVVKAEILALQSDNESIQDGVVNFTDEVNVDDFIEPVHNHRPIPDINIISERRSPGTSASPVSDYSNGSTKRQRQSPLENLQASKHYASDAIGKWNIIALNNCSLKLFSFTIDNESTVSTITRMVKNNVFVGQPSNPSQINGAASNNQRRSHSSIDNRINEARAQGESWAANAVMDSAMADRRISVDNLPAGSSSNGRLFGLNQQRSIQQDQDLDPRGGAIRKSSVNSHRGADHLNVREAFRVRHALSNNWNPLVSKQFFLKHF